MKPVMLATATLLFSMGLAAPVRADLICREYDGGYICQEYPRRDRTIRRQPRRLDPRYRDYRFNPSRPRRPSRPDSNRSQQDNPNRRNPNINRPSPSQPDNPSRKPPDGDGTLRRPSR